LRELRLVEREVPLTDPDPLRSRKGTYRVADRFLAFHFRHIQPHVSLIHAGRGPKVFEETVLPDFERLYDDARLDFVLAHLRSEAAELAGSEVVEAGRFAGLFVRAVARCADGGAVAAIVVPDARTPTVALENELAELRAALGPRIAKLVYGLTSRPERPLEVERVPEGELL
jgi:hypothetical protein